MSLWSDAWAQRGPAIDGVFGERLQVRHVAQGQFLAPGDDSLNPVFEAIGVLDVTGEVLVATDSGRAGASRSEIVNVKPQVDFSLSQFGDGRIAPVAGTVVVALDRAGAPKFRVEAALPSDDGRVVYQLVAM